MATPQQDLQPARDLVVADSTALTRSSDEDEATSSARREGSSEPLTPPRPSLFALLPTEVLGMIARDIATGTLDGLLINDPVFELARQYRVESLKVEIENSGSILLKLATTPETALNVKELHVEFVDKFPELQCAIFRNTRNLTHLAVNFYGDEDGVAVPDCFWWALRSLDHLIHLDIGYDYRLQPLDGFSLERDVPSLRKLDIYAEGSLAACAPGLSRLTHLKVLSFGFAGSSVPWSTLIHLDIARRFADASTDDLDLEIFLKALKTACATAPIPLQSLAISFGMAPSHDMHGLLKFVRVLRAPSLIDLAILNVRSFVALKSWTFAQKLPSVQRLTLSGRCDCRSADDLQGLQALLALCPALQALRLEDFAFHRRWPRVSFGQEKEAILTSIRQNRLDTDFPGVSNLLLALESTPILYLDIAFFEINGIHWQRRSADEAFEVDGWTVIGKEA